MGGASCGYEREMRFKLGLAIGLAAGYWYGSLPEEERKRQLDQAVTKVKDNPRLQRVSYTVSRNANKVTDAVEERVVQTADRAGSAVSSKAEKAGSTGSGGSDDAVAATSGLPGTGVG
jgi:hypothetical protein